MFYEVNILPSILGELQISDIAIFPNPTTGIINISFFSNSITNLNIRNVLGEDIYKTTIYDKGEVSQKINLSNFSSGVYILELIVKIRWLVSNYIFNT